VITHTIRRGTAIADSANYTAPATPPQPNTIVITVTPQADLPKTQATIAIQTGRVSVCCPHGSSPPIIASRSPSPKTAHGILHHLERQRNFRRQFHRRTTLRRRFFSLPKASPPAPPRKPTTSPPRHSSTNPVSCRWPSQKSRDLFLAQITVLNHISSVFSPMSSTLPRLATGLHRLRPRCQQSSRRLASARLGLRRRRGVRLHHSRRHIHRTATAPTPNAIQIVALSQDDSTQSGVASVSISSGSNILSLHPAACTGARKRFHPTVDGTDSSLQSGSRLHSLDRRTGARHHLAPPQTPCSARSTAPTVVQAANVSVQMQNSHRYSLQHRVSRRVAPAQLTTSSLSPVRLPHSPAKISPSSSPPPPASIIPPPFFDLNVAALALSTPLRTAASRVEIQSLSRAPPPAPAPPTFASFSQSGFDTSMGYTICGLGDVAVISKQPAGLGIIHLTVQIPSTALPGARTLFVQNANLDKTAASGVLEINEQE